MAQLSHDEQLELMREKLEMEQQKRGYDPDEPLDPVQYKSGAGRAFGAMVTTVVVIALFAVVASTLSALNAGSGSALADFVSGLLA